MCVHANVSDNSMYVRRRRSRVKSTNSCDTVNWYAKTTQAKFNIYVFFYINLFTTIHDGNFRRHSSMNVTIKWHKCSSNIYYIYVFFVIWSWKLRQQFQLQMTKNRTPTPVYLDPGMYPGLEVKGLMLCDVNYKREDITFEKSMVICIYLY